MLMFWAALLCLCFGGSARGAPSQRPTRIGDSRTQGKLIRLDLPAFEHARCLDSSPGGFYWRPASAANSSKWVIWLEGGGECVDEASCAARSLTPLGSSNFWNETAELGMMQAGPTENPDMYDWNMVLIKYCSGDLHLGQQTRSSQSLQHLRFSGHHIVSAVMQTLMAGLDKRSGRPNPKLSDAELVVWGGDSAGGIGSLAQLDWAAAMLPTARVVGAPIGGFYFSNEHPYNGEDPKPVPFIPWTYAILRDYHRLWDAWVPPRCAARLEAEPWRCIFAAASYRTLATPVFVIEAQTDAVVMPLHDGLPQVWANRTECMKSATGCPAEVVAYMRTWRDSMLASTAEVVASSRDAIFHPACLIHTGFTLAGPIVHGSNYLEAFTNWLFRRSRVSKHVDHCGDVLCNPTCPRLGLWGVPLKGSSDLPNNFV